MIKLEITPPASQRHAFTHLGFRPFFLAAGLYALVGILLWTALYSFNWQGLHSAYPSITWHAHEMVFGYAAAVAAGFLLTAIKNWTGQQTLSGTPLLLLAGLWLAARVLPFTGLPLVWTTVLDVVWLTGLLVAAALPIIRAKQWNQAAIVGKVGLLLLANALFYLGLLGIWAQGMQLGLYAGFYVIVALILTMGRRVIPFFIERGVGCPFTAQNHSWIDRASLILFLLFMLADLLAMASGHRGAAWAAALLALVQVPLHILRLWGWYHPNIWQKPLLWVLYLAYGWLIAGFALKFLSVAAGISPFLAVHAFAYGGIATLTVGMMARVTLGHTGRNVAEPPSLVSVIFGLLLIGTLVRVVAAGLFPQFYALWILMAQFIWIVAFALFVWLYAPMLIKPRMDGRYG